MTNKEALDNVLIYSALHNGVLDSSLEIIYKNLEVLEILKKHLFIDPWGDIVYKPKHHYQYINGDECELFKPNEEDTKIKKWLENEKDNTL